MVWTTTPWTLPANVAAAVNPDAEYGGRENGEVGRGARFRTSVRAPCARRGSRRCPARGPFDELEAQEGVVHRVIPWDEVSLDEGTGIVHIAPGAGGEDFELGRSLGLPVLTPVDEAGRFSRRTASSRDLRRSRRETDRRQASRARPSRQAGEIEHRYPICWRCETPLIFRVVDDWFIGVDDVREPLLEANATVEWVPSYMGKRMDDWLRNMGDWNISRRRYYGLPLPFYPAPAAI